MLGRCARHRMRLAVKFKMPSGRPATGCIRSCIIRIRALALQLSVSAMPRSGLGITLTGEELGGSQLGGFRTPVRIGGVPIRPLAPFSPVVANFHDGSFHHTAM